MTGVQECSYEEACVAHKLGIKLWYDTGGHSELRAYERDVAPPFFENVRWYVADADCKALSSANVLWGDR